METSEQCNTFLVAVLIRSDCPVRKHATHFNYLGSVDDETLFMAPTGCSMLVSRAVWMPETTRTLATMRMHGGRLSVVL